MVVRAETAIPTEGDPIEDSSFDSLIDDSGVPMSGQQREQLATYRDSLQQRNLVTNLTAVRDTPGIERRLLIESLRLVAPITSLPPIDSTSALRLIDVGTGGGIPGVVLAIALPDVRITLLEATGKKVTFLNDVIREVGLENCTALHGRAEDIGHDPGWRNQFDIVVARAVASLPLLLELCLPLARTGGWLVLPKGIDLDEELKHGERAALLLGGTILSADLMPKSGSGVATRLVLVQKLATTPRTYPRRAGAPVKNPLGVQTPKSGRRHAP